MSTSQPSSSPIKVKPGSGSGSNSVLIPEPDHWIYNLVLALVCDVGSFTCRVPRGVDLPMPVEELSRTCGRKK